jgi:hypothetical protein
LKSHLMRLSETCSISSEMFLISSIKSSFLGKSNFFFYSPPYIHKYQNIIINQ